MQRPQLAVSIAMAMVLAGLIVAVVPTPTTAASSTNCPSSADFEIPESEPIVSRSLGPDSEEIGIENISANESTNELHVQLRTSGVEMQFSVYHLDANDDCVEFTQGGCDGPIKLTREDETKTCDLAPPTEGTKSYWVVNENLESSDGLDYANWAPEK